MVKLLLIAKVATMVGTVAEAIVEAMTTIEEAWEAVTIEGTSITGILLKTNSSTVETTNMEEVQVEISVVKEATAIVSSMMSANVAAIVMAAVGAMTETAEVTTEVVDLTDAVEAVTSVAITTTTTGGTRTTTMAMAMDVLAPAHLTRVVKIQATYRPIKVLRTRSANATSKKEATTLAATTLVATVTAAAATAIADKTTTMSMAAALATAGLIKETTVVDKAVIKVKEVTTSSSPLVRQVDPRFQEVMTVETGSTSSSQEEIHPSKGADSAAAVESEHCRSGDHPGWMQLIKLT